MTKNQMLLEYFGVSDSRKIKESPKFVDLQIACLQVREHITGYSISEGRFSIYTFDMDNKTYGVTVYQIGYKKLTAIRATLIHKV